MAAFEIKEYNQQLILEKGDLEPVVRTRYLFGEGVDVDFPDGRELLAEAVSINGDPFELGIYVKSARGKVVVADIEMDGNIKEYTLPLADFEKGVIGGFARILRSRTAKPMVIEGHKAVRKAMMIYSQTGKIAI